MYQNNLVTYIGHSYCMLTCPGWPDCHFPGYVIYVKQTMVRQKWIWGILTLKPVLHLVLFWGEGSKEEACRLQNAMHHQATHSGHTDTQEDAAHPPDSTHEVSRGWDVSDKTHSLSHSRIAVLLAKTVRWSWYFSLQKPCCVGFALGHQGTLLCKLSLKIPHQEVCVHWSCLWPIEDLLKCILWYLLDFCFCYKNFSSRHFLISDKLDRR